MSVLILSDYHPARVKNQPMVALFQRSLTRMALFWHSGGISIIIISNEVSWVGIPMFEFIKRIFTADKKRQSLRRIKEHLNKKYGKSRYYLPRHIGIAFEDTGVKRVYLPYAYALFLTKDGFNALEWNYPEDKDYEALRSDIEDIGRDENRFFSHSIPGWSSRYAPGTDHGNSGSSFGSDGGGGGGGDAS